MRARPAVASTSRRVGTLVSSTNSNRNADAARAKSAGPATKTRGMTHAAVQRDPWHGMDHGSIQAGVSSRSARVQRGHGTFRSRDTFNTYPLQILSWVTHGNNSRTQLT